ncbi:MAG: integrase arm-type DNA-binding domain-containing protein, partial [Nitrosopumilus sp.]
HYIILNWVSRISGEDQKPGWYPDGQGLYLQVGPTGTKSWVFRYKIGGKERRQGLGSYSDVSLEEARASATVSRKLKQAGIDPIDRKRQELAQTRLYAAKGVSFKEASLQYIESHKFGWTSRKHEVQWGKSLEQHAYPVIGDLPIQSIDVGLVLKVLEPIWNTKTETASRIRQRLENICDWAKVRGYREGENPARWRGHLDQLLPKPSKVARIKHLPALHYSELPEFYQSLTGIDSLSAKALMFLILTAARSGEVRRATKTEVDLTKGLWVLPEERMKAGKEHRVPLSETALNILADVEPVSHDERIFPGQGNAKFISGASLLSIAKQYGQDITVHGFRSTFRDWCAEMTSYPQELAEAALAHQLKNKTEKAYQRGDLLQKRARLMDEWARYCTTPQVKADIVPISKILEN